MTRIFRLLTMPQIPEMKMRKLATILALCALSACVSTQQGAITPDETTDQFVNRVINSSGGYAGY